MILLLFLKFLIIESYSIDDEFFFKAKCEDDKPKTGSCFYELRDLRNNKEEYAIFDKCGKGKTCSSNGMCLGNLKLRKTGQSCNYDNECTTGSCISNKCGGANEGDSCEFVRCQYGLKCYPNSSGNYKCIKPAKEGIIPQYTKCMEGLKEDKDGKCTKYGTLEKGTNLGIAYTYGYGSGYGSGYGAENEVLCKSGLSHLKVENYVYYYVCDTLETEPVCEDGYVKTAGKWSDGTVIAIGNDAFCKRETDYSGAKKDYYLYSKLKSKLFEDFLSDYQGLDLEKINSDEDSEFLSGKIFEKYFLYENAPALQAAGIIDSEGKVVNSKKCEYEFMIKYLNSSSFMKLKAIIIALFALLF